MKMGVIGKKITLKAFLGDYKNIIFHKKIIIRKSKGKVSFLKIKIKK